MKLLDFIYTLLGQGIVFIIILIIILFKRKLEQKARNNAKIDVVAALVVSNIPQGIGRGLLTGGSIIGVRHLLHRGGRVLFKIQTAVEQAVRQSAVLSSGVAGPIVNM